MKNVSKKMLMFASVLGAAVLLSGCMMECPNKKGARHVKPVHRVQPVEVVEASDTIVVYQTYEDADVNHVYAKMYTHSSRGGESKMGHIKFKDTDKEYIIYTKNETDDKGLVTVYVSSVDRSSGETKLYGINDEEEWNNIKDVLRELSKTE